MKKIYVIKGATAEELAKNVNECEKDIFATQPMQLNDNSFVAFIYCNETGFNQSPTNNFNKNNSGDSGDLATKKQIYFLESKKVAIPEGLTKVQAIALVGELKQ